MLQGTMNKLKLLAIAVISLLVVVVGDLLAGLLKQRYGYATLQAGTKVDDFAQRLK